MQKKNDVLLARDNKTRRLSDVDLLLEVAIEEGGLDIHVMDMPAITSRKCKQDSSKLHPSNGRKGVIEVDSLLLEESACDQSSLLLDNGSNLVPLQLEHPFQGDHMTTDWKVSQLPSLVLFDGVHLLLHRNAPGRVALHLAVQAPGLASSTH